MLRTAAAEATVYGLAQVRRRLRSAPLDVVHVVFAPERPRPLLFGLVAIENQTTEPLSVDYTETWGIAGGPARAAEGASVCDTPDGPRALADASIAVRARALDPALEHGLALRCRFALPPGVIRELHFAYVASEPGEDPAVMVRAWRGDVALELERTVRSWLVRLGGELGAIDGYRRTLGTGL